MVVSRYVLCFQAIFLYVYYACNHEIHALSLDLAVRMPKSARLCRFEKDRSSGQLMNLSA